MDKATTIKNQVIAVLKTYLPPVDEIQLNHDIDLDLKISSDDFMVLPFDLERATQIKVPKNIWREEWSSVNTVQDIINLLQKYSGD